MAIGLIFGLLFWVKIGAWAILLSLICEYLWAAGGANKEDGGNKLYRRFGCAFFPTFIAYLLYPGNILTWLALPSAFCVFSLGYGIPSEDDQGSFLGEFFYYDIFTNFPKDKREFYSDICVRGLIYFFLFISFIPVLLA